MDRKGCLWSIQRLITMSYLPILGHNGKPTTIGNGLLAMPVAMVSPNPHPPWTYVVISDPTNCTLDVGSGSVTLNYSGNGTDNMTAIVEVFLTYDGDLTMHLALSYSSGVAGGDAYGLLLSNGIPVDGSNYSLTTDATPPVITATLPVPYYRYRLRAYIASRGCYSTFSASDWIKLQITLS